MCGSVSMCAHGRTVAMGYEVSSMSSRGSEGVAREIWDHEVSLDGMVPLSSSVLGWSLNPLPHLVGGLGRGHRREAL